ncbi:MAG: hypothetical protein ACI959_002144, partial [Limisphaerales bacterium]
FNFRYLQGLEAFNLKTNQIGSFTKIANGIDAFEALDIDIEYTDGTSINTSGNELLNPSGSGFATDLGVQIEILGNTSNNRESNRNEFQYKWKFGASLLDLGSIKFNRGATSYNIQEIEPAIISESDLEQIESVNDFQTLVSSAAYLGDTLGGFLSNEFSVRLPTAISLQADRNLGSDFYLSFILVRNIPLGGAALQREDLFAITPRYERKFFEFAVPVVFADDSELRVGASVRLGWLTIGSDDLGSILIPVKLNGSDIYAGIKINDFGFASRGKLKTRKTRNKKSTECPAYL